MTVPTCRIPLFNLLGIPDEGHSAGYLHLIDSTTEAVGAIFKAPRDGTIDRIFIPVNAINGSPVLDVRVEQVTAKAPNGTLWNSPTNTTLSDWSPSGTPKFGEWVDLTGTGVGASVSKGDIFAVVAQGKTVSTGINDLTIAAWSSPLGNSGFPLAVEMAASSWSINAGFPGMAARYSSSEDNLILPGCPVNYSSVDIALDSGDSPDEYGVKWVEAVGGVIGEIQMVIQGLNSTAVFEFRLYEGVTSTPSFVDNIVWELSLNRADYNSNLLRIPFPHSALVRGNTYRLTVRPQNTNPCKIILQEWEDSDLKISGFGDADLTTCENGGAFTDDSLQTMSLNPVLIDVTAAGGGASGNSGLNLSMGGGFA